MVGDVEDFPAELQPHPLGDLEVLHQTDIPVEDAAFLKCVAPQVPECRVAVDVQRSFERRGVKPQVRRRIAQPVIADDVRTPGAHAVRAEIRGGVGQRQVIKLTRLHAEDAGHLPAAEDGVEHTAAT